jgi:biotin transport system ATP-binding protein
MTEEEADLVEAIGLGKEFIDGQPVILDLDFRLRAGELVVLAGRNGSGKTVLCKLLAGLIPPTRGRLRFNGKDYSGFRDSHARRVGYAFQDARLQAIGEKVLDDCLFGPMNVGLGPAEAREKAMKALALCGLQGRTEAYVHSLSGGELRRLSLAGILALEPPALILDEPFANLDLDGVRSVLKIVKALLSQGKGILIATHEIEKVLGLAQRLVILDKGVVAADASPGLVLERDLEAYGLRNPLETHASVEALSWLD